MRCAFGLLLCAVILVACGSESAKTAADWKQEGDEAFVKGAWNKAYDAYKNAFALEDPVEARRSHRAFLSFRVARCLVRWTFDYAASKDASDRRAGFMYDDALLWLAQAAALDENEYWVWFERGLIFDRPAGDRGLAREAFETFLRIHDERTDPPVPPAEEMSDVAMARERLKALGG